MSICTTLKRLLPLATCAGSPVAFTACAHPPAEPQARAEYASNNDPAEPTNRVIFEGNKFADDNVMQPVARAYQEHMPGRAQKSIHNFSSNLGQPAVAQNDVLQGNFGRSWNTIQRFVINTTVGGAGLFDVATDALERDSLDDYATSRSAAAQRRAALVAEGRAGGAGGPKEGALPIPAPVPVAD